jgi:hypothetical protein
MGLRPDALDAPALALDAPALALVARALALAPGTPPTAGAAIAQLNREADATAGRPAAAIVARPLGGPLVAVVPRPPEAWTRSATPSKVTVTEPSRSVR